MYRTPRWLVQLGMRMVWLPGKKFSPAGSFISARGGVTSSSRAVFLTSSSCFCQSWGEYWRECTVVEGLVRWQPPDPAHDPGTCENLETSSTLERSRYPNRLSTRHTKMSGLEHYNLNIFSAAHGKRHNTLSRLLNEFVNR